MKGLILLLGLFLLLNNFVFPKNVPIEFAQKIAKNFYFERVNQIKQVPFSDIKIKEAFTESSQNENLYFIFNIENGGYVIVSADDETYPIIGYSFDENFEKENMAPALADIMKNVGKQIQVIKDFNIKGNSNIKNQWSNLNWSFPAGSVKSIQTVEPLILANWNQSFPYNEQCPTVTTGGSGGHVYVGCVAVAMAQVMKFYNYPLHGTGSYNHTTSNNGGYPSVNVNFTSATYNWSDMPYALSGNNINTNEVSKLMLHTGVAVEMNWGPDGSGSQTNLIADALQNYYKYAHDISVESKDGWMGGYTDQEWINLLKAQLDLHRPMVYSGSPGDGGAGHAWNCDGYQGEVGSEYFHMNWGWGGSNNGFFLLTNLYTPASPGQPAVSLMSYQQVIINIYPEASYPEFCTGTKTITTPYANFEDGSGNQNYQNYQSCKYLIKLACGSYVKLNFDDFDLEPNDAIYIYDGETTGDSLLAVYFGNDVPAMVTSTGNAMLINFVTNGNTTATGWAVNYTTEFCRSNKTINLPQGSFEDGSGTCDYRKSTVCKWIIDLPQAQSINVQFNSFNLASDGDYVSVYKYEMLAANLVQKFTYLAVPTAALNIDVNKVVVLFYSNSSTNAAGWALNYSSIINNSPVFDIAESTFEIYPNPVSENTVIKYDLVNPGKIYFSLNTLNGSNMIYETVLQNPGHYEVNMNDMFPNIAGGAYVLNIRTGKQSFNKKIIVVK